MIFSRHRLPVRAIQDLYTLSDTHTHTHTHIYIYILWYVQHFWISLNRVYLISSKKTIFPVTSRQRTLWQNTKENNHLIGSLRKEKRNTHTETHTHTHTHIYIYIYNSWNLDWDPWVSWIFWQNNNHLAVKKIKWIENRKPKKYSKKTLGFCWNLYVQL